MAASLIVAVSGLLLQPRLHGVTSGHARCSSIGLCANAIDLSGDGGCTMTTLRAPLPSAQRAEAGAYAKVHFLAALANGTVLLNSWDTGDLIERKIGAEPSETVRALAARVHFRHACSLPVSNVLPVLSGRPRGVADPWL